MSKYRWSASGLLLLSLGCFPGTVPTGELPGTPKGDTGTITWPAEVTESLAALEVTSLPRSHINEPPFPTKMYHTRDYYDDCPDAIDQLSKTPFNVDLDLLLLAQPDNPLPVRYRAVSILTHRKNQAVVPILERMCAVQDAVERFVAWSAYEDAITQKYLPPPFDYTAILALYKKESDREVHEQIAYFLGTARSKDAVAVLIETLRADPGDCAVVSALGRIGDPQAVPAVIAAFDEEKLNRHIHCAALGRLATTEGVDFLIAHLDEYGAVEALAATKSPKALSALQGLLDKLMQATQRDELEIALTKVAVTQLSEQNPTQQLLAFAEDSSNSEWLRHHALITLGQYETSALHPRLLQLFRDDPDLEVKEFCVRLLQDSSLVGVTEALIKRALTSGPSGDYREHDLQHALLAALNKRLGCSYRTLGALQDHLQHRSSKPTND